METNKKEEVGGGIMVATFIVTSLLALFFLLPPIGHYWGMWDEYWSYDAVSVTDSTPMSAADKARFAANTVCHDRAVSLYGDSHIAAITASSTSEDFSTYDCYVVKESKLPK